jgi:hypothetical protein
MLAPECKGQDTANGVSVVVSPTLFVPVSVAAQLGIQWRFSNKWSILFEGAYPTFYPSNTEFEEVRYWRAGAEGKYTLSASPMVRKYVGLQVNYLYRTLTENNTGRYYTKTNTYAYSHANINSPVLSSALKLGIEIPAGKRAYFDAFVGAGLRMVKTSYTTESALVTSIEPKTQNFFQYDDAWLFNYTLLRFHATAGFRFGFRL